MLRQIREKIDAITSKVATIPKTQNFGCSKFSPKMDEDDL